ncbi:MAG: GNAT family N-acetyltransferase [Desulfobacterales bacterium]|nr:GNAT family N-acetyltransferase [Desulfobacterales bacterium]
MQQIREAIEKDFGDINSLINDLGYTAPSEEAEKRLSRIMESNLDKLWIFEDDNQIKGWIHLFITNRVSSSSFAEIGGLVVAKNYRRKKAGKHLVEKAMEWAETKGLKIRVRCNIKRDETHTFYKSLGFSTKKSQHLFEI